MPKKMNNWKETIYGNLPNDWNTISANDYCIKVSDGTHDSPKKSEEGKLLITSKNIKNGQLDTSSAYKISFKDFNEVNKRSKVDQWDILLSMIGTVGEVCLINKNSDFAIKNVGLFKCGDETKAKWLYYFFRSSLGKGYLFGRLSGTTQKYVTLGELRNFPVILPSSSEQKAIARILGSLDDKIELLREQNETLEKIAQTIFKEWFVNFNFPDEDGKPYKDAGGKMTSSELGEIPEGWRVGKVKEVLNTLDSKRIPLSSAEREKRKGKYPYHGATSIMSHIDDYLFDGVYLLLAEDGSVMDKNGFPILQYVKGKFWVSNHAHILEGKNGFSTEMLYLFFKKRKISGIVTGAVQLKINQSNLLNLEIVIPDKKVLEEFDLFVQPVFEKIRNNKDQIQTLTKTRDALLPKLMSGEVRVGSLKG